MVELLIMSLLVILSLEENPGKKGDILTFTSPFILYTSGAVNSAGAHDKGSWYGDKTRLI